MAERTAWGEAAEDEACFNDLCACGHNRADHTFVACVTCVENTSESMWRVWGSFSYVQRPYCIQFEE